ncbi:sucrose-specific PTS transporter subunit IIBC [Liquorilactobacillus satsumensis]|uniref:protein-N(pi)-phosphohistidine--sucrose phosphotransferase n=1 Tax=Liquorilactobacillus satsumensis DSM 16230 = JCM 12392 TaxID=1423801 RepID=A0A0R1UVD2_9LACO|nr:sucrose-specific PTS transporter subunit IIBC [Liquorilactobacillus satsumensis]KRL97168.1 PTS system, sucrose-specific IIABC component [Liquorilactobacillus satsumensis DSM 16230 = JCM 12392]MCC7667759.1 PTS beta-glucoside transporter subunit EIIBCA [Liquorilactobacillus satsumensis]MCP9356910.1 PTS beta-glucoside transporter subunit IIBCA [Liquorilactobacillus satsumensis]MCP9370857.1 PTS beta-glucoside transporter subunit IIBCA [Liquorilactobacillus satsumensis]
MDYKKVAIDIIKAIDQDNIIAAAHCATRLRLVLKDDTKIDQAALDNNPGVKGTFKTNGQYQVIIGPGDVNFVYDELIKLTGLSEVSTEDLKKVAENGKRFNPVMAFIKLLSDIFVPIIPALVAGGLLMALNNILTAQGLFGAKSVIQMYPQFKGLADIINMMSGAPFTFMPILVGVSAAKRFGGNQYLGAAMGMIMCAPSLITSGDAAATMAAGKMAYWHIFGLNIAQIGYQNSVIPTLAAVYLLANLEKFFHKKLPSALDFTFTPLLAIIIAGLLTFILVGPVMRSVSDGITNGIVWLYNIGGFVGTGIFGLLYSPIVLTGLHQSFPAIETQLISNIGKTGGDFIFVIASMANVAQGAACLAVYRLSKNQKMRGLASSASASALLGITEPAMFGVNLKLKFPFFCAIIAAGVASAFAGFFQVLARSLGSAGFIGFLSVDVKSIPMYIVAELLSFVVAFVLTYLYGKKNAHLVDPVPVASASDQTKVEQKAATLATKELKLNDEVIGAPLTGKAESLTEVNDKVFSAKLMGSGAAIVPASGEIFAPVAGTITVAYETKHAYGIKSDNGAEVLLHIGIDTVELKGKFFETEVTQGQKVTKNQKLGSFDLEGIKQAGFDPTVMIVVTNTNDYASVERIKTQEVTQGDQLVSVTVRN